MGLVNVLRKLGVLRGGAVSWRGDAKDRPAESLMDDVYDVNKDLSLTKGDEKRPKD